MMLVTLEQLESRLRQSLDSDQAEQEIELASGVVARYANLVDLEQTADDEIVLAGAYGPKLPLPGGPVVEVSEVLVDGSAVSNWWVVKDTLWRGSNPATTQVDAHRAQGTWVGPDVEITVTYTHGYDTVPADIQAVVLAMAARSWTNPAGARQQTIDGYSVTWTNGVLSPEDKYALASYHRSSHSADIS